LTAPPGRYLQYRVWFITTDPTNASLTPVLDDINFSYR
jgi:hypothetical protein